MIPNAVGNDTFLRESFGGGRRGRCNLASVPLLIVPSAAVWKRARECVELLQFQTRFRTAADGIINSSVVTVSAGQAWQKVEQYWTFLESVIEG
jgi:hypothetical protein